MGVSQGYSKVASNGLVFAYDTGDTRNSYTGRPTTNISAGIGMNVYNNVPGSVSSTLTGTGTYYRGAEIIKQTLTALDGSGASWLSGGNNPGIGVYTGGGGGTGGRYTGHSIFFKPTFPVTSCPVYTHYSNIGGWQSSCEYDDMGDGWFRARVLWYAGSTQSDGKYWAINPASTSVGQTITLYWAGPFKEDLNVTNVSQYVNGTRSSTQGLLDISGKGNSISLSNISFDSSVFPQTTFDGTDDYINVGSSANFALGTGDFTIEVMMYPQSFSNYIHMVALPLQSTFALKAEVNTGNIYYYDPAFTTYGSTSGWTLTLNQWNHVILVRSGNVAYAYLNGVSRGSKSGFNTNLGTAEMNIGWGWGGEFTAKKINVVKIYNRALSAGEILTNYNHYKTRFNLP